MNKDELTQMLNHRAGKQQLQHYIEMAQAEEKMLSVILYDINELKYVNDTYGHKEGDNLLKYTTAAAKKCLRNNDFMFRLSGSEFVLVLYGVGKKEASSRMHKLLKEAADEKEKNFIFYDLSFSYGITEVYPGEKTNVSQVMARADGLMYVQKRSYYIKMAQEDLQNKTSTEDLKENFVYDKDHLYDVLIEGTDDYIFVGNMKTGVFRYPPAMVKEFGLPGEIVENAAALWGELVHPHDARYFLESNQDIADGRTEYHNIEYRAKNVNGEWVWLRCRGKMIQDYDGKPGMFAGMITNLGKKNQIDHMTGLYNRFEFEGDIKKNLVDENAESQMGIIIMDMDSFGNINDLYDRSFGDEVLRITAGTLESLMPSNAKIYRLDGDEFGIIIDKGSVEDSMRIFTQIQHAFSKQQEYNGQKYFSTLSAGVVFYPKDADNYLDLLKYANYSMEVSKAAGKNRITVFSVDILRNKERSLELTELLRESIERGFAGFRVYYQPQVDSITGALHGAEALARWKCDKYGEVSPGEFIPLLEKSGMIIPLGAWIFKQAMNQCRKWCQMNADFHMSVNFSYLQLLEGDIISFVQKVLKECEVNPQNVVVELTETYFAKEDEEILAILRRMREMGMKIAMDDFGVGYSSLFILKSIPVDIVKIDKEFVKDIATDSFNATFIRSITELCHDVGKRVCLEGVETNKEYAKVRKLGLELIQGYYFGRPVCTEEFEEKYFK